MLLALVTEIIVNLLLRLGANLILHRLQDYWMVDPLISQTLNQRWHPTRLLKIFLLLWETATRSHVLWVRTIDDIKEETRERIQDWFFGRVGDISLQD